MCARTLFCDSPRGSMKKRRDARISKARRTLDEDSMWSQAVVKEVKIVLRKLRAPKLMSSDSECFQMRDKIRKCPRSQK